MIILRANLFSREVTIELGNWNAMIFDRLKYSKLKFQSLQRFYVVKSREINNERSQNDGDDFKDI